MKKRPCDRKELCSICGQCSEHCPDHFNMLIPPVFMNTDSRSRHAKVCGFVSSAEDHDEKPKRKGKRAHRPEAEAQAEIEVYTKRKAA